MTSPTDPHPSYYFHPVAIEAVLMAYGGFLSPVEREALWQPQVCVFNYLDTADGALLAQNIETVHIDDTIGTNRVQSYVQSSRYTFDARWQTQSAMVDAGLLLPQDVLDNTNTLDLLPSRVDRSFGMLDYHGSDICLGLAHIVTTGDRIVTLQAASGPNHAAAIAEAADDGELAYMDNKFDMANVARLTLLIDRSLNAGLLQPMTHLPVAKMRNGLRFWE